METARGARSCIFTKNIRTLCWESKLHGSLTGAGVLIVLWHAVKSGKSSRKIERAFDERNFCMITLKFHCHTQEDFRYGKLVDQEPRFVGNNS